MTKFVRTRLIVMNLLQWAIWGAYLTSMGNYLGQVGFGANIGLFYAMQGIVSIFMPALMGIVADKWLGATKALALCQFIAGAAMLSWHLRRTGRSAIPCLYGFIHHQRSLLYAYHSSVQFCRIQHFGAKRL